MKRAKVRSRSHTRYTAVVEDSIEQLTGENYDYHSLYDYLVFKIIQLAVLRRRNAVSEGHVQANFS